MNQSADKNSFGSEEPIADLEVELERVRLFEARMFLLLMETMKSIFKEHWNPREHGVIKKIFLNHWRTVGPEGIRERIVSLCKIADGAMYNKAVNNPPAYFTKCAKELLKDK